MLLGMNMEAVMADGLLPNLLTSSRALPCSWPWMCRRAWLLLLLLSLDIHCTLSVVGGVPPALPPLPTSTTGTAALRGGGGR
jgi:hypothetical protein